MSRNARWDKSKEIQKDIAAAPGAVTAAQAVLLLSPREAGSRGAVHHKQTEEERDEFE